MKKQAFTLAEVSVVLIVIGILAVTTLKVLRQNVNVDDMLQKAGLNELGRITLATTQIISEYSTTHNMKNFKKSSGTENFSIADNDADVELSKLYRKMIGASRSASVDSDYTSKALVDIEGATVGYSVSDFTQGFVSKNGTYIAFQLNGDCTTSESHIYNPSQPKNREAANSCGLIFFDVNSKEDPNTVGIDQYIISIGKNGIK